MKLIKNKQLTYSVIIDEDIPHMNPYHHSTNIEFYNGALKIAEFNNRHKGIIDNSFYRWIEDENVCEDSVFWFLYDLPLYQLNKLNTMLGQPLQKSYIMYYDESNNNLKFQFKNKALNTAIENDFVLAGIAFDINNKIEEFEIKSLFDSFKLQSNITDIKLNHLIGKKVLRKNKELSKFELVLRSSNIEILFKWLLEQNVFIHCSAVNLLYYSLVDIIDSLIIAPREMLDSMKNVLFHCVLKDREKFLSFLASYNYPNLNKKNIGFFCSDFLDWIEGINPINEINDFNIEMIKQLLKKAKRDNQYPYLENNQDGVMIENYKVLYLERLMSFPYSKHYFDEISEIQEDFDEYCDEVLKENVFYEFIKSDGNYWIELSDIISGIFGSFFIFLNTHDEDAINECVNRMDDSSKKNLVMLHLILDKATNKEEKFVHYSACHMEIERAIYLQRVAELLKKEMNM